MNRKNLILSAGVFAAVTAAAGYGVGYLSAPKGESSDAAVVSQPQARRILYYRNPMGLPDTSPVPKKDSMGMDYIPVYDGEDAASSGTVSISPEKVQKLGVKTAPVERRVLERTVRAVGTIRVDERGQYTLAPKFEGWIEKLHVNTTGQAVRKGEPLMEVYSPELVSAQREYLIAYRGRRTLSGADAEAQQGLASLADAALERLRNWDIGDAQLKRLRQTGEVSRTLTLAAPVSGVVMEKPAVEGMRFMPGDDLLKIADLHTVWLIADVFEQDLRLVRVDQTADLSVDAYPGRTFRGRVTFIYPDLTPETRTAKVRIELPNSQGLLKPAMFGTVKLAAVQDEPALAVPDSAVIDSGTRKVVLVTRGDGRFEPREVRTGMRAAGYLEVLEGLAEGETVVTSANFLIDAESNLKAALGGMGGHAAQEAPGTPASTGSDAPTNAHGGH